MRCESVAHGTCPSIPLNAIAECYFARMFSVFPAGGRDREPFHRKVVSPRWHGWYGIVRSREVPFSIWHLRLFADCIHPYEIL